MKVVSTEALTKLIQLVKSAFIKVDDVVEVTEIETETPSEVELATVATSGSYNDLSNKPTLATVATSGSYNDLSDKPTIPSEVTESTVSGWGFTKNAGTITGITMNGSSKGTSGVVDLGTVITAHQDISGKVDKTSIVSTVSASSTNAQVVGAKLFYDTCGDIETLINAL